MTVDSTEIWRARWRESYRDLLPAEPRCPGVRLKLLQLYHLALLSGRPNPVSSGLGKLPSVSDTKPLIEMGLVTAGSELTGLGCVRLRPAWEGMSPAMTGDHFIVLIAAEVNQHLPERWIDPNRRRVLTSGLSRAGLLSFEVSRRNGGAIVYYPTDAGSRRVRFALGGGNG